MRRRRLARLLLVWAIDAVAFWLLAAAPPGGADRRCSRPQIATAAIVGLLNAVILAACDRGGAAARVLHGPLRRADPQRRRAAARRQGPAGPGRPRARHRDPRDAAAGGVHHDAVGAARGRRRGLLPAPRRAAHDPPRARAGAHRRSGRDLLRDRRARGAGRCGGRCATATCRHRALARGRAPTALVPWECDLSSQTGASQAGLLLRQQRGHAGVPLVREGAAGGRWSPTTRRTRPRSSGGSPTATGCWRTDGASRGNLFSGDAPRCSVTISMTRRAERSARPRLLRLLRRPVRAARARSPCARGRPARGWRGRPQRRRDVRPRIHRGGIYPLLRAGDHGRHARPERRHLIGDIVEGVPVAYATFVGYDEVAHHSGIERPTRCACCGGSTRSSPGWSGRRRRRRGRTTSWCSPTTARARARRSGSATARRSRSCVRGAISDGPRASPRSQTADEGVGAASAAPLADAAGGSADGGRTHRRARRGGATRSSAATQARPTARPPDAT